MTDGAFAHADNGPVIVIEPVAEGLGDPRPSPKPTLRNKARKVDPLVRFERHFIPEPNSGCWLWIGGIRKDGYGQITGGYAQTAAHRISWTLFKGPIPEGKWVLHKCDIPICVNPNHLWLGTHADNVADRNAKKRQAHGEKNASAKLTEHLVRQIRTDKRSAQILAKEYGVSQSSIDAVRNRTTWRLVP